MMIRIQINLSLLSDGSFVAQSMIIRTQNAVPASTKPSNAKKISDAIIGHSAWTKDYTSKDQRFCATIRRYKVFTREVMRHT
jgi:hypothetical protein